MTGADQWADGEGRAAQGRSPTQSAQDAPPTEGAAQADAAELIAQIRELAGPDPAAVREVVADVLAALDRVTGGTLREQLPDEDRYPDDVRQDQTSADDPYGAGPGRQAPQGVDSSRPAQRNSDDPG